MAEVIVLIEDYGAGHAVAAIKDGLLIDFVIDPFNAEDQSLVGSIMAVKVDAPKKGINGTFVSLPNGRKGFIRGNENFKTGSYVLVYAGNTVEDHKAQPVSSHLIIKGKYTILTPGRSGINVSRSIKDEYFRTDTGSKLSPLKNILPKNCGLIVRSRAIKTDEKEILIEAELHIRQYMSFFEKEFSKPEFLKDPTRAKEYASREWFFEQKELIIEEKMCFDRFGVWEQISKYLLDKVLLSNGGFIMIEVTSALVAVDINTAADTSRSAAFKTNLLAMKELPRQLRIRGLGGKIVVEFAPLAKQDRSKIEIELNKGFDLNKIQTTIVGWTKTGNLEIQRKREKLPIGAILSGDPRFK